MAKKVTVSSVLVSMNVLGGFMRSTFGFCLLKMVCLFTAASLWAEGELVQAELQTRLVQTEPSDTRFTLYKELLALQLQSYRANHGNVEALASAIHMATLADIEVSQRQKYIDGFNVEEREIYTSYDALLNLANDLALGAASCNRSFYLLTIPCPVVPAGSFQLNYLQILELEEALGFPVHGATFWVREQALALTNILILLENEIKAMHIKGKIQCQTDLTLEHKELQFYWTVVNLCHEFLSRLDSRWSQCDYNRLKILNLVFGKRFSFVFPYPDQVLNPIDLFLPFLLKHADLDLAKERFDQINHSLSAWDLNYEWVALYVRAAKLLLSSDQEKAKTYLEKAKKLTEDTLWCSPFSFHRADWNAKQEEARQLLESVQIN